MSKHKAAGKTRQQSRTSGKRLGLKASHDEPVSPGVVIVRQRGTKYKAAEGVGVGRDHTLFAEKQGKVKFGKKQNKTTVSVV